MSVSCLRIRVFKDLLIGMLVLTILLTACGIPEPALEREAALIQPTNTRMASLPADPSPTQPQHKVTSLPAETEITPKVANVLQAESIDPFSLVSMDSLFVYLKELTAIQPYSGWRNSASQGETEALDYVESQFEKFPFLQSLGIENERQRFAVFNATEIWETRLFLTFGGKEFEAPADGMRGSRDDNNLAQRFDSDGLLNDMDPDPVVVTGNVILVDSVNQIDQLSAEDVAGKIILLDYDVIHPNVLGDMALAIEQAETILALRSAGIVLITRFSDENGKSHGSFISDSNAFTRTAIGSEAPVVPILYTLMEDLAPLGISSWDDLAKIESARLVWDMDVIAPGHSGNLAITIPGLDRSKTLILSAHIDSSNNPGALDDGSGSVVLMETARVLDQAQIQPAVDLLFVWFGSEELGAYGSTYFVSTHQDLLDRTLAMLQIDCLTRPMEGVRNMHLEIETWSYGHFGDDRLNWPEWLSSTVAGQGLDVQTGNSYAVQSDNSPFGGFDVPHANLIYTSNQLGSPLHYKAHIHSPYDNVDLAREVAPQLKDMANVALAAALATPSQLEGLRVTPPPDKQALFLANHTEAMTMSPVGMTEFGMALASEGYDIDLLPYGETMTAEMLEKADLVVVMPVYDYGSVSYTIGKDEAWSEAEIDLLEAYVRQGGFLLLTNSASRIKFHNWLYDQNENWRKMNALAERFGIRYGYGTLAKKNFWVEKIEHPLLKGISYMEFIPGNAIPLRVNGGLVLAQSDYQPVIVLTSLGEGQALALADLGILGNLGQGTPENLPFWLNLAGYISR